jgi:putative ABC transport system permease protein
MSEVTGTHRRTPRRRAPGRWRLLTGDPGPGPALALAVIALLAAFVAMAGPRELTAVQNTALRQTIASAGSFGISASDDWQVVAGGPPLSAAQVQLTGQVMGGYLRSPLVSPAASRWYGMTTPLLPIPNAPPRAILGTAPVVEMAYRTALAGNARLVSGSFPRAATSSRLHGRPVILIQAAVTTATAARFGWRPGSLVPLGAISSLLPTDPTAVLSVTGLLRPTDPAAAFWTQDPSVAAPTVLTIQRTTAWAAGVFVGPGELAAVQDVFDGAIISLSWEYPLVTSGLSAAQAPGMLAAMTSMTSGNAGQAALQAVGEPLVEPPTLAAAGSGTLSTFIASQAAVASTDSLLLVGIVAATAILLLVGGVVVTDAYATELALARARGGSTRQLAARILATAAGVAGPALVVGAVAGIFATPGGANPVSWILVALVTVVTLAAPALLAGWRMRGLRALTTAGRGDLVIGRRSPRRLIVELTALIVVAGGVLALRLRGLAPGSGFDPYLSSAPVLVAAAAGLIAIRVYPVPLRLALRVTASGRGTVGYLGMARSARARSVPMLPALALVVALTVIALGGLIRAAVTHGQVAASWQQVGADALVEAAGSNTAVSPAARQAIAAVPGVRLACAAYVIAPGSSLAANQISGAAGQTGIGLVIADPAQYAALVADTPWPSFPAALLAPPRAGSARAAIPVITSPGVAAAMRSGPRQIGFGGSELTIRVVATASSTPALPGGGSFVILPSWASSRVLGSVAPNTVLISGSAIDFKDLQAVAAHAVPGSVVVSRAAVLQAAAGSPLVRGSDLVFEEAAGAAAACAVAAVLLGLLLSGRDRTRLGAWLTAMGMTARQGRRLAVLDALPLVLVAILGAEIAGLALGPLIGPGLVLSAFTGSSAPVPLQPDLVALIAPAVGAVVLIIVAAVGQSVLARRRSTGTTGVLRLDEGR